MFEIKDRFYLDGKPFQIISGAFHYFRTVPEYWRDRLEKLVNLGCNTVETYIPWNLHEPRKGEFHFDGMHDVCRFLDIATELGLYIILRPSPYICAEWEFGGLPAWLLKDKGMRLRCSYEPYLKAVDEYYSVLLPKVAPYQVTRGGNVILMQVENEYGYYGNDKAYLSSLVSMMRKYGIDVPLVTSDGPWNKDVFRSGMTDEALPTGNFGSSVKWQFDQMERIIGRDRPLMCMEFWCGWFDAWGEEHHTFDVTANLDQYREEIRELLTRGNVNFYMFEGGTNFGFYAGRNQGKTTADVTSYDYDAILTEDGRITPKYTALREMIREYAPTREVPLTTDIRRISYGRIECAGSCGLVSQTEGLAPAVSAYPLSMEDLDCYYGYVLYRIRLPEWETLKKIQLEDAHDRAIVIYDGKIVFTALENIGDEFEVSSDKAGGVIDILIENIGRENFGTGLESQRKGILGGVRINDHRHFGYEMYGIDPDSDMLERMDFSHNAESCLPGFYKFTFSAEETGDTFLDTTGFGKGVAFVNGFDLGRFWDIGPQKRLYIPAPLLRKGENTIILLETDGRASDHISLESEPMLG